MPAASYLNEQETRERVAQALTGLAVDGQRVLVLIPDSTRSMPMPLMFDLLQAHLAPRTAALDFLVALGTHQPMNDAQLSRLVGRPVTDGRAGASCVFNHEWADPDCFMQIGTISAGEIAAITGGRMAEDVPVRLNRRIEDYDHIMICGPVFPHEVVGFSGGNKYFFPGIAGPEIINFTHWLGAVLTNYHINGAGYTPVRAVIDRAAAFIQKPISCFSLVVTHQGLAGLFYGSPQESWHAAATLAAQTLITTVDRPYERVISVMPAIYDDLWTAAKGMYKLEPVVADGGEVVIYAPHITEVSYTHGRVLDEIGYHCCEYFLQQWEQYRRFPHGVLAHSTHRRGLGTFQDGVEKLRIRVTLATGIPEERCRQIGLGYLDPASLDPAEWMGREAEGILVVPRAGEMLYRLRSDQARTEDFFTHERSA